MRLQDLQDLPSLSRFRALHGLLEIDQQTERFLPRSHQIDGTLEHEDEVLDLLLVAGRVLLARVQIQARSPGHVPAVNHLLARFVLLREIRPSVLRSQVFAPPYQCGP